MLTSGLVAKDLEKVDDIGWKSKLKIPPKDKRIKTSVRRKNLLSYFIQDVKIQR